MKLCRVEGCECKTKTRNYCTKHYTQILRYGKVLNRTRFDSNEIIIKKEIAEIILYNKKCKEIARATIDTEDIKKIKKHKWYLSKGYVGTNLNKQSVCIQHIIMDIKPNKSVCIDHENHNPLDNTKNNLRVCTQAENNKNVEKRRHNTSGFKGVFWHKGTNKWRARIGVNKKHIHVGLFKDKTKAAAAYNKAALKYHKEFACLNNI